MNNRDDILEKFAIFQGGTGGLDSWLNKDTPSEVFEIISSASESSPLSRARFNQLLTLAHEAPVSDALFNFYWLSAPATHPYNVTKVPSYSCEFKGAGGIESLDHLYWGLYRFYVDALLFFGSIRTAFQRLRVLEEEELSNFFLQRCFDPDELSKRGEGFGLSKISKDDRYLISEMACKSFGAGSQSPGDLEKVLVESFERHRQKGGGRVTVGKLLADAYENDDVKDRQLQLEFSSVELQGEFVQDEAELLRKVKGVALRFDNARQQALENTKAYLSMVGDLDVYVATSMRKREDFRAVADFCERVFDRQELKRFNLRYFDPTVSAANNHEDKGLIECLMVKCAKILVLQSGASDSYGKDAEAAMALSLGKPVIIHTSEESRKRFFRDVHPLSRLIDFSTGVAIGAMVTDTDAQVAELIRRILSNDLEYDLCQPNTGYLVLKEKLTKSVVRLQTSDSLLRETFWNHYNSGGR